MDFSIYNDTYYETGAESGKSLYSRYRWLPELTRPMCERIAQYCHIHIDDTIMDFGCAKGFVVKAFREQGYRAFGIDASAWVIENCDPQTAPYLKCATKVEREVDWIICKDVLEHIPEPDLTAVISNLLQNARKGVFVVVPLSAETDGPYVVADYEKDITHVIREPLGGWLKKLNRPGWCAAGCWRVPGIKDNYFREGWEKANGFIVVRPDSPNEE